MFKFGLIVLACIFAVASALPVKFGGVTTKKYHGDMTKSYHDHNGYDDAMQACSTEFKGSRVCTAHDLGVMAQFDGIPSATFRYIDISQTRNQGGTPVDDCKGFTSNETEVYSMKFASKIGGTSLPEISECTEHVAFACCIDE